jgi:hypothetical protein
VNAPVLEAMQQQHRELLGLLEEERESHRKVAEYEARMRGRLPDLPEVNRTPLVFDWDHRQ